MAAASPGASHSLGRGAAGHKAALQHLWPFAVTASSVSGTLLVMGFHCWLNGCLTVNLKLKSYSLSTAVCTVHLHHSWLVVDTEISFSGLPTDCPSCCHITEYSF